MLIKIKYPAIVILFVAVFFQGCTTDPAGGKKGRISDIRKNNPISLIEIDKNADIKRVAFKKDTTTVPLADEINFEELANYEFTYRDLAMDVFWRVEGDEYFICPHPIWCHIFCRSIAEFDGNIVIKFEGSPYSSDGKVAIIFSDGEEVILTNFGKEIDYSSEMSAMSFDLRDVYGTGLVGYTSLGKAFEFRDPDTKEIIQRVIINDSVLPVIE